MGVLDAPLRKVSATLMAKFGRTVTLRFLGPSGYDADTGTTDRWPTDVAVKALVAQKRTESGTVRTGQHEITIAAQGLPRAPTTADKFVDGQEYEITGVDPVYSGDEIALFTLHVKR